MPKMSVSTAARPTCASAWLWTAGSCMFPPDWTRPVTPAATISGPAASSSHGLRIVLSLRNSLRIMSSTVVSLARSEWARSVQLYGQLQERRLQRVVRLGDLAQRPGEAKLSRADDHYVVRHLGDLAEHVAGDHDGAALARQAAQQAAEPGDAGRVEAVGRLVEQGRGQAQALTHAEGETAHAPAAGRRESNLVEHLVRAAIGQAVSGGQDP